MKLHGGCDLGLGALRVAGEQRGATNVVDLEEEHDDALKTDTTTLREREKKVWSAGGRAQHEKQNNARRGEGNQA